MLMVGGKILEAICTFMLWLNARLCENVHQLSPSKAGARTGLDNNSSTFMWFGLESLLTLCTTSEA